MQFKRVRFLVLSFVVGMLLGLGFYHFVPQKYVASGSLLVARKVQPTLTGEFSYEGYYAQQAARGYSETLIGFLESTDARKKALESLGMSPSSALLKQARRATRVKKPAPQVVTVEVSRYDANMAKDYWTALVSEVLDISGDFNMRFGDPLLSVGLVDGSPVVYAVEKNVYLDAVIGAGLGLVFALCVVFLKDYLRGENVSSSH